MNHFIRSMTCAWIVLTGTLLLPVSALSAQTDPIGVIERTTSDLRSELGTLPASQHADPIVMSGLIERHVAPHIDFQRISRSVIGKSWRQASEQQREKFVAELRKMMFRTYARAIGGLADSDIQYGETKLSRSGNIAMIPTQINKAGGSLAMNYYLVRSGDSWRLYDISVSGVRMLTMYKRTFKQRMTSHGMDGLIEHLVATNLSNET